MKTVICLLVFVTSSLSLGGEDGGRVQGRHAHVARRIKRAVDKWAFTVEEKQELLDLHNKYRREVMSTDMLIMTWDYNLERMAQSYADQCVWTHSENRYNSDFRYIGENLYAKTIEPSPLEIVKDWNDEKVHYNYFTQQCTRVCGHYTQVVWAESEALGCGIRFCPSIDGLQWERYGGGYVVVCNYGPGGNIVGQRPFNRDQPACSDCPRSHKYCIDGLCSPTMEVNTISASRIIHSSCWSFLLVVMVISLLLS